MKRLSLSPALSLPLEAVTQTFAILGKRGSGKTSTSVVLTEEMITAGLPVVVVDPVGVWFGLRYAADGKGPGLPVVILGGEHADIPLEDTAGAVVADFAIESSRPMVLDLSGMSKSAARRFMVDFSERLYHDKAKRKDALHVVLDEADLWAPQRTERGGERLLGAINDLVRRGRARGIGCTLITQRPAVLNKDVLSQAEVLVALRLTGPHDRKAIETWVQHNADQDQARELLSSLAQLPVGTAWVWSPGWLDVFKTVAIRARRTFDSSATPKAGARSVAPRDAAKVDLEDLRARMAATIERAAADDPRALRARITELEAELAARPAERELVHVPTVPDGWDATLKAVRDEIETVVEPAIRAVLAELVKMLQDAELLALAPAGADVPSPRPAPAPQRAPAPSSRPRGTGDVKIGAGELAILTAAAQHIAGVTREQLSVLTGYKRSSRDTYLQRLKAAGLVEQLGELLIATDAGTRTLGPDFVPLPTGRALREHWLANLPEGERRILDLVCRAHPKAISRDRLSEKTGYKRSSRDTYLQRLGARRLIEAEGRGEVRASSTLF